MKRAPWCDTLVPILLLAACSSPRAGDDTRATVDTLASGRVRVTNTGEPTWTDATAWRLEEDLRLGTGEESGPAEQQFGLVGDVVADARGRIYVLDVHARTIRVFAADGTYLRQVGAPGEGPGELAEPIELSLATGDTLWVADQGRAAYSVFGPDGEFVRVLRRPNFLAGLRGRALPAGRYVQWGLAFPDEAPGRVDVLPIRIGPTATEADTFPPIRFAQRLMGNGAPAVFFSPRPVGAAVADGTIWFALSDDYEIHRRTLEGDTTLTFRLPATPHPVDEADRNAVEERVSTSRFREEYLASLPAVRPVIGAIAPDEAGHVYVLVDVAGAPGGSAVDVFAEDGGHLGRLTLPVPLPDRPILRASADHLYAVVTDELDVQYVSRLKIDRSAAR